MIGKKGIQKMNWRELNDTAARYKQEGDLQRAIEFKRRAIEAVPGSDSEHAILLYNGLASLYYRAGEIRLAEGAARKTLELELQHGDCGAKTTNLGDFYVMLAKVLEAKKCIADALKYADKAIHVFSERMGAEHDYVEDVKRWRDKMGNSI